MFICIFPKDLFAFLCQCPGKKPALHKEKSAHKISPLNNCCLLFESFLTLITQKTLFPENSEVYQITSNHIFFSFHRCANVQWKAAAASYYSIHPSNSFQKNSHRSFHINSPRKHPAKHLPPVLTGTLNLLLLFQNAGEAR